MARRFQLGYPGEPVSVGSGRGADWVGDNPVFEGQGGNENSGLGAVDSTEYTGVEDGVFGGV